VIAEAVALDRSILADDAQSTVTSYCFLSQRSAIMRLGIPAVSVVMMRPGMPNWLMSSMLRGKPMAKVIMLSFRLNLVWPWLFMRLPMLRFPRAVYR